MTCVAFELQAILAKIEKTLGDIDNSKAKDYELFKADLTNIKEELSNIYKKEMTHEHMFTADYDELPTDN